ncbi:MAG: hypothetical protein DBY44_03365 [Veillonellaceae bacterium]|nr:MAG: hypothetical protein DBY44_03365 [Veillonellaceae bacterium]
MVPVQTKYKEIKNDFPTYGKSFLLSCAKQNVLFLQRASMRKLIKGKHEKRCSFLERKGDRRSRWIVDSTLFE